MSGARIYDAVVRVDDPAAAVRSLTTKELRKLGRHVDLLPESGVPLLIAVLVDEEILRRYMAR